MGGKYASLAMTRTVAAHMMAADIATLERMVAPTEPSHNRLGGSAAFRRAYAMTKAGKPRYRNAESHAVVCSPAPSRPPGANTPGKVSNHGMTMSPAKRYPFAIAREARERRIANWLNSRTAAMKFFTKIAVP